MRRRVETVLGLLVGCAGALVGQEQPGADGLAARLLQVHDALPEGRKILEAAHVSALERVADSLPSALDVPVYDALRRLIHRVGNNQFAGAQAEALHPRLVAWCERLARRPDLADEDLAGLDYILGETHFAVGARDEASACFQRCARRSSRLAFDAHSRAFRVELGRQRFRAAAAELDAARAAHAVPSPDATALRALRLEHMTAHLALRIGLFDTATRTLNKVGQDLATVRGVRDYDREQQLLLTTELGFNRQDHALAEEAALALQRAPGVPAATVQLARVRELEARIGRGGDVPLATLQEVLATADPRNRPGPALALVRHALRLGAEDVAAATATALLAGRSLVDSSASLETLLAVGCYELRSGHQPSAGSPRWHEWESALDQAWRQLLAEWHDIEVETEGLAFLQMPQRRDVLGLWLHTRMDAPDGPRACFDRYLEADAMGSVARRRGEQTLRTDEVLRELVPPHGALLVFLPSASGSHVLWLAHDGARVFALPPEGQLRERVFALRRVLAGEQAAVDEGELRALALPIAELVSGPELAPYLARTRTLLVAGYDLLHSFPVELLPIDGPERWLGLRHPICYLPSITVAMDLVRRARGTTIPLARLLAGTRIAELDVERWGHAPVAAATAELRAALAAVADRGVDVRGGASRADLTLAGGVPSLLAVVAHGIFDGGLPCPGGFLLAPDATPGTGAVFAPDVPRQGLARVAFLGVCGATRAALRLGEDGGHRLSSVFLTGGSDAVVATDVGVRVDEVLALLASFMHELVAGADVAHAMLQARRSLFAAAAHPRIWATMRLEGLATTRLELPPAPRGGRARTVLMGVLVVVLGGGIWWVRRRRLATR